MEITLKEIAKLAGVSIATASRVANNLPGVKAKTREHVLQIIQQYHYQPDLAARSLAQRSNKKSTQAKES